MTTGNVNMHEELLKMIGWEDALVPRKAHMRLQINDLKAGGATSVRNSSL